MFRGNLVSLGKWVYKSLFWVCCLIIVEEGKVVVVLISFLFKIGKIGYGLK